MGTRMIRCASCDAPNPAGRTTCYACGGSMYQVPSVPPVPAKTGSRKLGIAVVPALLTGILLLNVLAWFIFVQKHHLPGWFNRGAGTNLAQTVDQYNLCLKRAVEASDDAESALRASVAFDDEIQRLTFEGLASPSLIHSTLQESEKQGHISSQYRQASENYLRNAASIWATLSRHPELSTYYTEGERVRLGGEDMHFLVRHL